MQSAKHYFDTSKMTDPECMAMLQADLTTSQSKQTVAWTVVKTENDELYRCYSVKSMLIKEYTDVPNVHVACDYVTAVLTILQRIIGIAQDNELINAISHAGLKRHI